MRDDDKSTKPKRTRAGRGKIINFADLARKSGKESPDADFDMDLDYETSRDYEIINAVYDMLHGEDDDDEEDDDE